MNAHSETRTRRMLVAAVTLLCASVAQAWTVTADPTASPPGSQVTVNGKQFPPNSRVQAFLKWRTCAADTDARGNFTCRLKVPHVAQPGPEKIWTVHRPTGQWFPTAFTVRTDWGNEAFDGGRTRYNPYENVLNRSNVGRLKRLWTAPGTLQLVAGGRVFLKPSDFDGILALNESDGQEAWRLPEGRYGNPASAQGRFYVATSTTNGWMMLALSTQSGDLAWKQDWGYPTPEAWPYVDRWDAMVAATAADRVYVMGDGNFAYQYNFLLRALQTTDGAIVWSKGHGFDTCTRFCAYDGRLSSLVADNSLYMDFEAIYFSEQSSLELDWHRWQDDVVNAESGTATRWRSLEVTPRGRSETGEPPAFFSPQITFSLELAAEGLLLYRSGSLELAAEERLLYRSGVEFVTEAAADGQRIASWKVAADRVGTPALAKGIVYAGATTRDQSALIAVRARDGTVLWRRAVSGTVDIQPTVANGVIYLGRDAYDARNGNWLWSNPDLVDTVSPIVVNGRLYANQIDGTVSAWGLQ